MASKNEYREYRKGDHIIVPPAQGIYEESATQMAPLGTRLAFADGRVFRYAYNGAVALGPGLPVKAAEISAANYTNKAVAAAAAAGTYIVYVTTAAVPTVAQAKDGWLQINDANGEGIQYKIKSVKANATTATSTDVTLYDPIATALTTSSEATVIMNPYYGTLVTAANTDILLGIPPIAVTASYYYWLQTWGWAITLSEGTPAAGSVVQYGYGTGGTTTKASHTVQTIGQQLLVGVATEYKPIYLMLAP